MDADNGERKAIILDVKENSVLFRQRRRLLGNGRDFDLHLRLKSREETHAQDVALTLDSIEHSLQRENERYGSDLSGHVFVFGNVNDPFLCGKNRIDLTLRVIELLATKTNALIHIQTRSPLAILALPVLRQISSRVCVTMGIETLNDTIARRVTPWLPRPSERVTAARAINTLGIATLIQAAPLGLEAESPRYARSLNEISSFVYSVEFPKLQQASGLAFTTNVVGSSKKLAQHISEYKLISSIPEAWSIIEENFSTTSEAA